MNARDNEFFPASLRVFMMLAIDKLNEYKTNVLLGARATIKENVKKFNAEELNFSKKKRIFFEVTLFFTFK